MTIFGRYVGLRLIAITTLMSFVGSQEVFAAASIGISKSSSVQFEWRAPKSLSANAAKQLGKGAAIEPQGADQRFGPIVIIAGVVALGYLVHVALDAYREVKYGGVILTVDGKKLEVSNDPRMSSGLVVLRNQNKVELYRTDRLNEGDIITKVAEALAKS